MPIAAANVMFCAAVLVIAAASVVCCMAELKWMFGTRTLAPVGIFVPLVSSPIRTAVLTGLKNNTLPMSPLPTWLGAISDPERRM